MRDTSLAIPHETSRLLDMVALDMQNYDPEISKKEAVRRLAEEYIKAKPHLAAFAKHMSAPQTVKVTTSLKSHKRVRDISGSSNHKGPIVYASDALGLEELQYLEDFCIVSDEVHEDELHIVQIVPSEAIDHGDI